MGWIVKVDAYGYGLDKMTTLEKEKFIVPIPGLWQESWPTYFDNFYTHCAKVAQDYGQVPIAVLNSELKPLGGKLIQTKTQGWYLRWDDELSHTMFMLRWA